MTEVIKKEKTIIHPLEEALNIERGTTVVEYNEVVPTELLPHETYDEKDNEIEDQLQEVYDKAMAAFDVQAEITDIVEGKYSARNGEVAVQYLNTALQAVNSKANLKQHKDKLEVAKEKISTPNKVQNNLIVTDHSDLLRQILNKKDEVDN